MSNVWEKANIQARLKGVTKKEKKWLKKHGTWWRVVAYEVNKEGIGFFILVRGNEKLKARLWAIEEFRHVVK